MTAAIAPGSVEGVGHVGRNGRGSGRPFPDGRYGLGRPGRGWALIRFPWGIDVDYSAWETFIICTI